MSVTIPVDKEKCQAMKPNGQNFMTFGGGHKMINCENTPTVIATEKIAGSDGEKGSMSLCNDCLEVFLKQVGRDYADIVTIT